MLYPTEKLRLNGDIPVNCYIIQRNKECFIIDPGYEKEKIRAYIKEKEYHVKGILLTHAHIDHIEALDCFNIPIYIHEKEVPILNDTALNGFDFFHKKPTYRLSDLQIITIKDKDTLSIGNDLINVQHTPGHTQGSVCYQIGFDIYTGDTLFESSVGRWDRPTANLDDLKKSIRKIINTYTDNYLIHPSHGKSSTILTEKRYNPFILEWSKEQPNSTNH